MEKTLRIRRCLASILLFAGIAGATSVPHLSFNELTDASESVVSGQIVRSWSDWDAEHKFIWTHHEVAVSGTHKGRPTSTIVISEPGGIVGNRGLNIAGSVAYHVGENVVVFAQRMPNGYLRTTGWGQGKYLVDSTGHLHADSSLAAIGQIDVRTPGAGASLRSLEGMTVTELKSRIAARIQGRVQ